MNKIIGTFSEFIRDLNSVSMKFFKTEKIEDLSSLCDNPELPIQHIASKIINRLCLLSQLCRGSSKEVSTLLLEKVTKFEKATNELKKERTCLKTTRCFDSVLKGLRRVIKDEKDALCSDPKSKQQKHRIFQCLLLTSKSDPNRSMTSSLSEHICAGIPVVTTTKLMKQLIEDCTSTKKKHKGTDYVVHYIKLFQSAMKNPNKTWVVYKVSGKSLVVLIPRSDINIKKDSYGLNIENLELVDNLNKLVSEQTEKEEFSVDDLIKLFNPNVLKHICWEGHGSMYSAMEMPFSDVQELMSKINKVAVWHLHSCYLQGNIQKIFCDNNNQHVKPPENVTIVSSAANIESFNIGFLKNVPAYYACFRHILQNKSLTEERIKKILPILQGLIWTNSPQIRMPEMQKFRPVNYDNVIDECRENQIITVREDSPILYLRTPEIFGILNLSKSHPLILSGNYEGSNVHFINKITSMSSFQEILKKTFFGNSDVDIWNGEQWENREMLTDSKMNDLFFVEKLQFQEWGDCFTLHNSVNTKCVKNALVVRKNMTLYAIYGVQQDNDSIVYYKTTYDPLIKKNLNWKTEFLSIDRLFRDYIFFWTQSTFAEILVKNLKSILSKRPNLKELDLSCTNITREHLDSLDIDFSELKKLDLMGCKKLTDKGLKLILSKCHNLKELNLTWTNITGEHLDSLGIDCPILEKLELSYCIKITDKVLKLILSKCHNLKELALRGIDITGEHLDSLDIDFSELKKLDLMGCKKLTDKGLKLILSKCHNLKELNLTWTNITGEHLDSLGIDCPILEKLNLSCCKTLTVKDLKSILSKCPNLKELDLSCSNITGEDLVSLKMDFPKIKVLPQS